jgi:hypothetical protein
LGSYDERELGVLLEMIEQLQREGRSEREIVAAVRRASGEASPPEPRGGQ